MTLDAGAFIQVSVFWFVTIPLLTLVHELGHAIVAVLVGGAPARAWIGTRRPVPRDDRRKLEIRVAPFSAFFGGFEFRAKCLDSKRKIAIYLAGPLVSALVATGLFLVTSLTVVDTHVLSAVLHNAMYGAAVQLLVTIVPVKYPAWMGSYAHFQSDGKRILDLWQGR